MMTRKTTLAAVISATALLASCEQKSPAAPVDAATVRLASAELSADGGGDLGPLADRDTTTAWSVTRQTVVIARFDHDVEVRDVWVGDASAVEITGVGFDATGAGPGWTHGVAATPQRGREFRLTVTPTGPDARIGELELWGGGRAPGPRGAQALAEATRSPDTVYENIGVARGYPASATLDPAGLQRGDSCGRARFQVASPRAARRAYLVYEANVQRSVVLSRSLDGAAPVGGFWISATEDRRTLVDELDPEALRASSEVALCLPVDATGTVRVDGIRLVTILDDGTDPFERDAHERVGQALDRDAGTSATFSAARHELAFERPIAIHDAEVRIANAPARLESVGTRLAGAWQEGGALDLATAGVSSLPLGGRTADAVELTFGGAARGELPAASVTEVAIAGSGIGPRIASPRLVITYPALTYRDGRVVGERFGDRAFVQGWAESPAGPGRVEIDGADVAIAGVFAAPVSRSATASGSWLVTVRATFPDGTEVEKTIDLAEDRDVEAGSTTSGATLALGDAARFGRENQAASGEIDGKGGKVTLGTDVSLDVPDGAVAAKTALSIARKGPEVVPPLDAAMINVTAPPQAGYRFLPRGQRFAKPVRVTLPYDASLLPEGVPPEDVRTYYYDEQAGEWRALPRVEVQRGTSRVVSETTHFTFMINAVLVLPDHPGPASFDPNSLKDLKAADPSAGIDLIEAPEANNDGTAQLSLPIRIPRARGVYQPDLRIAYDSGAGNGWLGVGWNVAAPSIQVDTKFGVPFYDGDERYVADGTQLVPVSGVTSDACEDGSPATRFRARVEQSFRRIRRCGTTPESYWWEVTDKGGTVFVYGRHAGARLASYRDDHIGQWMLEQVIDANGNLAEYIYEQDQRDADDNLQGEDFRQLYLRTIRYSGKAVRDAGATFGTVAEADHGAYVMDFHNETSPAVRPDVITSARFGFKVATRRRLGSILVRLEPPGTTGTTSTATAQTIREYRLAYEQGSLGKWRLQKITLYGAGDDGARKLFHEHTFRYTDADLARPFSQPQAWTFPSGGDDLPLSQSEERGWGYHFYGGIGPPPDKFGGSAGVRRGSSQSEGETRSTLLDVNGDGLPDRLVTIPSSSCADGRCVKVQFNQGGPLTLRPKLPPGDPAAGDTLATLPLDRIGHEKSSSTNNAGQAGVGPAWVNAGKSSSWSESDVFLADADGDGRVDLVTAGGIFLNQPRSDTARDFQFLPRAGLETIATDPAAGDPDAAAVEDGVMGTPSNPILEWLAPYVGDVDVSGQLAFARDLGGKLDPSWDGVRLKVYRVDVDLAKNTYVTTELLSIDKKLGDQTPSAVGLNAVHVTPGTRLVFMLSTLSDFPVDPSGPSPIEAVSFAPIVAYRSGDPAAVDPTGAPIWVFDAARDFRLAGQPMGSIGIPVKGTLALHTTLGKRAAADFVHACVQKFPADASVEDIRCDATPKTVQILFDKTYPPEETFTGALFDGSWSVEGGEKLVFRIDSDLPIDPGVVDWTISGEMTSLCDQPNGGCRPPADEDAGYAKFTAEPYVKLHLPAVAWPLGWGSRLSPSPSPIPPEPWVAPAAGTYTFNTRQAIDGGLPQTARPVYLSARTSNRLLFKTLFSEDPKSVTVSLAAGERVYFEAHSEEPFQIDWEPSIGSGENPILPPVRHTSDTAPRGSGTVPLYSIFAGGYHGWRYGIWRSADAFDASKLIFDPSDYAVGDAAQNQQTADQLGEGGDTATRLQLAAPLIPRRTGTRWTPDAPGLAPDVPAYVTRDGTTYVTQGGMHAAREGGLVKTLEGTVVAGQGFHVGKSVRKSGGSSKSFSAGVSIGVVGINAAIATGKTFQKSDVVDLNGDRVIDVTSGDGVSQDVRITNLHDLSSRPATHRDVALRKNTDVTVSAGLGVSNPWTKIAPEDGIVRAVVGMLPGIGVGGGVNLSATEEELVDINGDGLPDAVQRDGACRGHAGFTVRLNLGTSFAEPDCIPAPEWKESKLDGLSDAIRNAPGVSPSMVSPNRVRRTTAVSLQSNLGFAIAENYAAGANWESSISATSVVLMDVTGDGLPDYVRKSPSDPKFYVMVNTGSGFEAEREWDMPAWPGEATKPWINGSGVFGGVGEKLLSLIAGSEFIDAVEVNGTYSAQPNVDAAYSWGVLVGPGTPYLHFTVGGDMTLRRVSGYELGMMDMDGDGLIDHVLKAQERDSGSNEKIWVRHNTLGGANLLVHVDRPLGGAIDMHYARIGNTVDMPESRWVLDWMVARDGRTDAQGGEVGAGGHELRTDIEYGPGRYDRVEREFLGFESVTLTNPRPEPSLPDGVGAPLRTVVRSYRNDRLAFKGLLLSERLLDADGRVFTEAVNEYADPYADPAYRLQDGESGCDSRRPFMFTADHYYCGSLFPAISKTIKRFYEGQASAGITTVQSFHYDAYGNVEDFEDLGDASPANAADDVKATVVYADDPAAAKYYSVARPFRIEVKDARGTLLRKREGYYDVRGNLSRLLSWVESGRSVESVLQWNDDGLLHVVQGPFVDGKSLTYTYGYDPVVRTYVESVLDSHGYVSTAKHDYRFGEVTETTDINKNVTTRVLDDFGRVWRIFGPDDTNVPTIETEYALTPKIRYARTKNRGPDGRSIDTVVLVDGLRRVVQTKKTVEQAIGDGSSTEIGWAVSGRQSYDALLRVVEQGQTAFQAGSSPLFYANVPMVEATRSDFDVLDRATRTDAPVEPLADQPRRAITDIAYGFDVVDGIVRFRAEVTDPERNLKAMFRDPAERAIAVEERNAGERYLTRYAYDPVGQLLTVTDAAGNVTRLGYDLVGHRTSIENPDSGLVSFVFDDAGNLKEKRTPNLRSQGKAIVYSYDYDQLVGIDYPDGQDVAYEYGKTGADENGAGRIVRVLDDAGSETRGYGRLGELIRTTRVVKPLRPGDQDKTFETRFRFDPFGRMLDIVYPDHEKVSYTYDAGGLVRSAVGERKAAADYPAAHEAYLRSLTYDVFGQRRRLVMGNGAVSTYEYYPQSRRLASLHTEISGRTLQALTYVYDRVGNVRGMTNALLAPTPQRPGPVTFTFQYDQLYRLTSATGRAETRPGITDAFTATYAYDRIHDMTSNVQEHTIKSVLDTGVDVAFPPKTNHAFEYAYEGKGPHQATKIGDQFLVYDANGNTLRECRDHGDPTCTSNGDGLRRYYWSDDDRLDAVIDGGGLNVTRFVYDAAGDRVAKLGRGGESLTIGQFFSLKGRKAATKHVFVGETRLASKLLPPPGWSEPPAASDATVIMASASNENGCDSSDYQPQKCPVYPGPNPAMQHRIDTTHVKPATYYYHPDHLGSTSWVTDQNGRVHEHVEYFPYGEVWRDARSESDGAPVKGQQFLFTSKEMDEETGLYYVGARYLDPVRARWTSADALTSVPTGMLDHRRGRIRAFESGGGSLRRFISSDEFPASLSRYSYGLNNPARYSDPTGNNFVELTNMAVEGGEALWIDIEIWVAEGGPQRTVEAIEQILWIANASQDGTLALPPPGPAAADPAKAKPAPAAQPSATQPGTAGSANQAKPRFVAQPDGQVVDTTATPAGSYDQPGGGRTDVLQKEDHGAGQSHTHDPKVNTAPNGKTFVNGRQQPGRPVSAEDVKNIQNGTATPSPPKGR